jgi:hypothetical protein
MQETTSKINRMERSLSSNPPMLVFDADMTLKVTSYKGMSETGSLLRIHRQTTTSHVQLTRPGLQLGSSREVSSLNGKKGDPYFGFMENVKFPHYWHAQSPDDVAV